METVCRALVEEAVVEHDAALHRDDRSLVRRGREGKLSAALMQLALRKRGALRDVLAAPELSAVADAFLDHVARAALRERDGAADGEGAAAVTAAAAAAMGGTDGAGAAATTTATTTTASRRLLVLPMRRAV